MKQFILLLVLILCCRSINAQITLLNPVSAAKVNGCTTTNITWTQDFLGNVILDYSLDNGTNWVYITNAYGVNDTNRYNWLVPNAASDKAIIRIRKYADEQINDSSKLFTILADATVGLTLTAPNGGESIPSSSFYTIKWNTTGIVGNVSLQYSVTGALINGGSNWNYVTDVKGHQAVNIPNTGSYTWLIPYNLSMSSICKVRIVDYDKGCIGDYSNNFFSITTSPSIAIRNPVAGETWYAGKSYPVQWSSNRPNEQVDIDYSTDKGTTWINIQSNFQGNQYSWLVPNELKDEVIVRVRSVLNNAIESLVSVKIAASSITLLSPVGGEILNGCSATNIRWFQKGGSNVINLDYSIDGGNNWIYFADNYYGNDTVNYPWDVPSLSSTTICACT